jgi:hypothetical protein
MSSALSSQQPCCPGAVIAGLSQISRPGAAQMLRQVVQAVGHVLRRVQCRVQTACTDAMLCVRLPGLCSAVFACLCISTRALLCAPAIELHCTSDSKLRCALLLQGHPCVLCLLLQLSIYADHDTDPAATML